MDSNKFGRLVREFPFLAKILVDQCLSAGSIEGIHVRMADRNILEVRPGSWYFDAGSFGSFSFRNFWIVSQGDITRLKDSSYKAVAYVGEEGFVRDVGLIANQLVEHLNREIGYIIEITNEGYDWEEQNPTVIVYKMKDLDWRNFCRPQVC